MKVLLDTNVVARTIERGHPHHQSAVDAIRKIEKSGHQLFLVPQVLYELWVILTRPISVNGLGYTTENAHRELLDIQSLFVLLRDERSIFEKWLILVLQCTIQGKQAHDARLVAAMQRHGISRILTFNQGDFARFPGIVALLPDEVIQQSLLP